MATGILVAETHVEVLVYGRLIRQLEEEEFIPAIVVPVLARLHRDDVCFTLLQDSRCIPSSLKRQT